MKLWQIILIALIVVGVAWFIYNMEIDAGKANFELGLIKEKYNAKVSLWQVNDKQEDLKKELESFYNNRLKNYSSLQAKALQNMVKSEISILDGMIAEKAASDLIKDGSCTKIKQGMLKVNESNANYLMALNYANSMQTELLNGKINYAASNEIESKISANNLRIMNIADFMSSINCS